MNTTHHTAASTACATSASKLQIVQTAKARAHQLRQEAEAAYWHAAWAGVMRLMHRSPATSSPACTAQPAH